MGQVIFCKSGPHIKRNISDIGVSKGSVSLKMKMAAKCRRVQSTSINHVFMFESLQCIMAEMFGTSVGGSPTSTIICVNWAVLLIKVTLYSTLFKPSLRKRFFTVFNKYCLKIDTD